MASVGGKDRLWLRVTRLLLAILILVAVVFSAKTSAQFSSELQVDVNLDVADTVLRVEGKTSPQALVTIMRDSSAIGTVTAGSNGAFEKVFQSQTPGLHTIKLFAQTADNQMTDTVTETISLTSHAETTLTVFLPSILNLSSDQVEQGSTITFSGVTYQAANVTVVLDNNLAQTTTAGSDGRWKLDVSTDGFYIGTHSVYAVSYDQSGDQSVPTTKRVFQVTTTEDGEGALTPVPSAPEQIKTPIIASPQSEQHFSQTPIEICGLTSQNAQVEVWEDGEVIGSVFANSKGEWCFKLDLSRPRHEITVRACFGSICSNFSKELIIFYDGVPGMSGLLLELEKYRYTDAVEGESITLGLILEGGEPPYEVAIDWGSDSAETITLEPGRSPVSFAYETAGLYTGIVTARDRSDQMQTRYFSVMVTKKPSGDLTIAVAVIASAIALTAATSLTLFKRKSIWRWVVRRLFSR